jgi:DtxR family Mn-dependent transcriptional regulator
MIDPLLSLILGGAVLSVLGWLFWPDTGRYWRWKERSQRTDRVLLEDAVKHLHQCEENGRHPSLESLAGALSISMDRASWILETAQEAGLVSFRGDHLLLTEAGREAALRIIRAHRVWEKYLAEYSGFGEEDWHGQADRREHDLSSAEVNRLSASLGFPTHDPHGDPIPTPAGEIRGHGGKPLTEFQEGSSIRIVHVEDEPDIVYAQIVAEELHPGMELRLEEKSPNRIRIWSERGEHVLAPLVARNLSVVALENLPDENAGRGIPLSALSAGQSARVLSLASTSRGMDRRRLLDLGVVPGTVIRAEMVNPGGDPTAYRIRGSLIALRDEQAGKILIEHMDSPGVEVPEREDREDRDE